MASPKFTAEELAALTDEEREGLEDDTVVDEGDEGTDDVGDEEEPESPEKAAAAAETEEAEKPGEPEKKEDEPAKPAEQTTAEDPAKAQADDQPAPTTPAESRSALPAYEVPADVGEQIEAIRLKRRELAQKFDDGEITAAERAEQDEQLLDKRDELKEMMLKAAIARDSAIHAWSKTTVPGWLAGHVQYQKGTALYSQLNEEVKRLQAEGGDPFDPGILDRAHGNIQAAARAALGLPPETPNKKPAGADAPKPPKRPAAPPSLQSLPAADPADIDDGGEFAYLDRLADKDPLAYEKALEKLEKSSPDKFSEYMAQ